MKPELMADIGVARLGLPIPMAKLLTIHKIATALNHSISRDSTWAALLRWVKTRELESDVLEAIYPLLLCSPNVTMANQMRQAIQRPSILSDHLLALATGNPVLIHSWQKCHSGHAPTYEHMSALEAELASGRVVPQIFGTRFRAMERATGYRFMHHWAYEFSILNSRSANLDDGHLDYFTRHERENEGILFARRGHLARSAYLRTVAFAADQWSMPLEVAVDTAAYAFPVDPIFTPLSPGEPPAYALRLHGFSREAASSALSLAQSVVDMLSEDGASALMHFNGCVVHQHNFIADLEIFSLISSGTLPAAQDIMDMYEGMLGKVEFERDNLRAFLLPTLRTEDALPAEDEIELYPTVGPIIARHVGYLQSDLLQRLPYLPFAYSEDAEIEALPTAGGTTITNRGQAVGSMRYWLWKWNPTHPKNSPPGVASCTTLSNRGCRELLGERSDSLTHAWRLTVRSREKDYGNWEVREQLGLLP
jgi:hypothetical protein